MHNGFLYLVTSPSGKRYVGVTSLPVSRRWNRHLVHADMAYLYELEPRAIEAYGTRAPRGYNLNAGGEGGQAGLTDEQRRDHSRAMKEAWKRKKHA